MSVAPAEREVARLIDAFGEALHAQDLGRSMELLASDADLAVIPSEGVTAHRGPDAVRDFLSRIYALDRRYGWRWRDRSISIAGDSAWFVAEGDEIVEEPTLTRVIPYCLTGVAVRAPAGWRLRLLHASEDGQTPTTE